MGAPLDDPASSGLSPRLLLRRVAIAEAITWGLLLIGMFLKYATRTTELGVQVAGPIHGVVFVAYCVTCVVVAVDQRWSVGRLALGLLAAVPPFLTLLFDRYAESRGLLGNTWPLRQQAPDHLAERPVAALVRRPVAGLGVGVLVVVVITGAVLVVGPPF